jgi:hypothetical protein
VIVQGSTVGGAAVGVVVFIGVPVVIVGTDVLLVVGGTDVPVGGTGVFVEVPVRVGEAVVDVGVEGGVSVDVGWGVGLPIGPQSGRLKVREVPGAMLGVLHAYCVNILPRSFCTPIVAPFSQLENICPYTTWKFGDPSNRRSSKFT